MFPLAFVELFDFFWCERDPPCLRLVVTRIDQPKRASLGALCRQDRALDWAANSSLHCLMAYPPYCRRDDRTPVFWVECHGQAGRFGRPSLDFIAQPAGEFSYGLGSSEGFDATYLFSGEVIRQIIAK